MSDDRQHFLIQGTGLPPAPPATQLPGPQDQMIDIAVTLPTPIKLTSQLIEKLR